MYTPRALCSRLFLKICLFFLSLYTVGQLVTLTYYEISFESPSLYIRDQCQSMVCVHTYSESDNALLRYGHLKFFKMAAGHHLESDPKWKWCLLIHRPRKPHPRTKHEGDHLRHCRVMAVWNFPKMCELALRSVGRSVGRSVVNIHTSYTDLIYSSFATFLT